MRPASDMPSRRRLPRLSTRLVVVALALTILIVIVFGRAMARFYVDALWFDALGRDDVFWGQIRAKLSLFGLFFGIFLVVAGVNLYLADRAAPSTFPANMHPYVERFHELFGHRLRFIRYVTALVLAFILALPASSRWQEWLLFRHGKSFGVDDPQFGVDVGFYVFTLPFLTFAIDWLFAALVIVLLLTLAAHLLNGGVMFTSSAPTIRPATRVHLAALLAVLAAVKAADYWISRYSLTNETRGFVQGATYTVVNAQIPSMMLLMLVALVTAGLFIWTIRSNRWRVPMISSAIWLTLAIVAGLIYPAFVQWAIVRPNQGEREAPYIDRNVTATRAALGLDEVVRMPVQFSRLTTDDVEADVQPLRNVRMLNPTQMLSRFDRDRGEVAGLKIADLDVDRYALSEGSDREQVLIAAREPDLGNVPNRSWQGEHLTSTRGCGLVMAAASKVTTQDRPGYVSVDLERPELYFSPDIGGYAVARTDVAENPCTPSADPYSGTAGVQMSSFVRRAAFALAFLDYNVLGSGAINSDSQMLWIRSVVDRAQRLAPFLDFDGDPYPVVVEGGVQWVVDAYTSTSRYPYAQRIGNVQLSDATGLSRDSNYVRNSVKVAVDAYTGEVTFYVVDTDDPIVRAWRSAFPDLFSDVEQMPAELRAHLRYPEDLFRVQSEAYSKYQVEASNFFSRDGAWSVAQAPPIDRDDTGEVVTPASGVADAANEFAAESNAARFIPYYTMFADPDTGQNEFVIIRPFVPFSPNDGRTDLQGYLTASSDPSTYGRLISYVVDQDLLPPGPLRVADQAVSEQDINPELNLLASEENGSKVRFGDLQLVPIGDGLLYVRPVYVVPPSGVTEFRYVIVSTGTNAVLGRDLDSAVAQLFAGFDGVIGDRIADDADPGDVDEQPPVDEPGEAPDAQALLEEAERLFDEADAQLQEGQLGEYQRLITEAQVKVAEAIDAIEAVQGSSGDTDVSTTIADGTTDA
jgi:uncharacterized membrane protein (UPF0182 family)